MLRFVLCIDYYYYYCSIVIKLKSLVLLVVCILLSNYTHMWTYTLTLYYAPVFIQNKTIVFLLVQYSLQCAVALPLCLLTTTTTQIWGAGVLVGWQRKIYRNCLLNNICDYVTILGQICYCLCVSFLRAVDTHFMQNAKCVLTFTVSITDCIYMFAKSVACVP